MLILAGDIGGTTTRLAFFRAADDRLECLARWRTASREHASFAALLEGFWGRQPFVPERACFGVAGPLRDGRVSPPNIPWVVDGAATARLLGLARVTLLNDLQANAWGIPLLDTSALTVLNPGRRDPHGPLAVLSAGTGLGECTMVRNGETLRPLASEGGHADFAPRDELEADLMLRLRARYGRVSVERVVSGPGLVNIHDFLRDRRKLPEHPAVSAARPGDPAPAISAAGLAGECPLCAAALELFVSLYGAAAGNLALRSLPTGGLYLGGGIAPKILPALRGPAFMRSFTAKGRLTELLETIPVSVIGDEETALLGAANCARRDG